VKTIKWGIIGCGDVTEVKSGPAFNKVSQSKLVAVMRRNGEKAKDYALRHNVPKWYDDANQLINDPEVNAIYVATPPLSHEEYTIAALQSGKPVYVEKPMALNAAAGTRMMNAANENNLKLTVAHYRRAQPMFLKIKELLDEESIGDIKFVDLKCLQPPLSPNELQNTKTKWRVDPTVSGGGLFHDLAPHQLDLMLYFFGEIKNATGVSYNQAALYAADDIVCGNLLFESGVIFNGVWCFSVTAAEAKENCEINGSEGVISFSVFGDPSIRISRKSKTEIIQFEKLAHVQQPMIGKCVEYFLDQGPNPCSAENGVKVMRVIDQFTCNEAKSRES
jgi:predicted dehydrogenase